MPEYRQKILRLPDGQEFAIQYIFLGCRGVYKIMRVVAGEYKHSRRASKRYESLANAEQALHDIARIHDGVVLEA